MATNETGLRNEIRKDATSQGYLVAYNNPEYNAGMPDIWLARKDQPLVFVELKFIKKGWALGLTDLQRAMIRRLHRHDVCAGWAAAYKLDAREWALVFSADHRVKSIQEKENYVITRKAGEQWDIDRLSYVLINESRQRFAD